ncbi:MAG: HAD-IC family P-type ATPase, partial [Nanoarchaeota archaeon]
VVSAEKAEIHVDDLRAANPRIDELPFDSERKMMSTAHRIGKKTMVYSKGAPDKLIDCCTHFLNKGKVTKLTAKTKKAIMAINETYASQALRVLAFAYKEGTLGKTENGLVFVGLQGMIDPPRDGVRDAVARCKTAGIRAVVITGDHKLTAKAVAHEIGIDGDAMDSLELEKISDEELIKIVRHVSIFARVNPKDKLRIVEALKKNGEIVAMTGDGVNDAPAIKKAHMGIAMGITGTDVTKEASDMILTDDNFASIVNAVEEGRGIYDNINKFINYLLSSNLGEVMIIFFATLFGWGLPLTAIHLLWINLVTDGLPALALGVDPASKGIMQRPPRDPKASIMNRSLAYNIVTIAILITVGALFLFEMYVGSDLAKAQTMVFTALVAMELVRIQGIRSEYKLSLFSNKYLVLALASSIALQLLVIYTPLAQFFGTVPLGLVDWAYIIGVSAAIYVGSIVLRSIKGKVVEKNAA